MTGAERLIVDFFGADFIRFYAHPWTGERMVTVRHFRSEKNYELMNLAKSIMKYKRLMRLLDARIAAKNAA